MIETICAPVLITVYTRLDHLKMAVEALQENQLHTTTDLYIASDAASREEDKDRVKNVRAYCSLIKGFRTVTVFARVENVGAVINSRSAFSEILERHGRIIALEDDIVVSPRFLSYMNKCLDIYEHQERVVGICGYRHEGTPIFSHSLFLHSFCAWGWGTWKKDYDRLLLLSSDVVARYFRDMRLAWGVNRSYPHLHDMLLAEFLGKLSAFDVRVHTALLENDLYCIFPGETLTKNMGFDGSGIHCGVDHRFAVQNTSELEQVVLDGFPCSSEMTTLRRSERILFGGYRRAAKNLLSYMVFRTFPNRLAVQIIPFLGGMKRAVKKSWALFRDFFRIF